MPKKTNIPKGYKDSPLGIIPEDWEIKRLEEICDTFKSGIGITSKSIKAKGIYPVYGGNGLRGFTDSYTHEGEYFLIGRQGALCGNITWINGKTYISEHAIAVQTNKKTNNLFLSYKLDYLNLNKLSESSAQPGLSVEKLLRVKISTPPLHEQKAIAACLSIWDQAIQLTTQLIAQKELRKKYLMQQLLSGKKRLKGFKRKWEEHILAYFFTERNETGNLDMRLLSIGQNGVYPQSESTKKDTSNEDKTKYKKICPGDIGYNTMRMWQGRSALSSLEGIVSPAYTIVTPKKNADSLFFSYLFKTPKLMNLFWRNSQGLVDDTLNCKFKDFSKVKFILPEKEEQSKIAFLFKKLDDEIRLHQNQLEQLKNQKKGLMQLLLTGKKRLKLKK